MDALKIQTELLKKAYKGRGLSSTYGIWDDDHIAVIPEGHYIAIIPNDKFFLNINAVWSMKPPFKIQMFKDSVSNLKPIENTMISKNFGDGIARLFYSEDKKEHIYVDEKILKLFETKESSFKGTDSVNPIYVFEDDEVVGIILPIKRKENN